MSFFFPVQLALLLLILLNLYLVLYIPLFFGCFVRGCLTVFQWRPVLLSSHFSQFSSAAQPCPTLCNPMTTACQASQSITNSQSLLRLMSIESVMTPNHYSVVPVSSCLQSFPASGCFQMSQFFTSGGQSIRVSTSASVLPIFFFLPL